MRVRKQEPSFIQQNPYESFPTTVMLQRPDESLQTSNYFDSSSDKITPVQKGRLLQSLQQDISLNPAD